MVYPFVWKKVYIDTGISWFLECAICCNLQLCHCGLRLSTFFRFAGPKGAWCRGPVLLPVRLCSAAGHKCQGLHWLLCRFCYGGRGYGEKVC